MHNGGDLWEQFHDFLKAKGTNSVTIKWAKGHAKQEHIDKGATNTKNKSGNDKADENAEEGTELHHRTLREATKWLANRHRSYTKFMKNVATHIIEAYIIHKQLDEMIHEDGTKCDKRMYYKSLRYPLESRTNKMHTIAHLGHYSSFIKDDATTEHIHSFLENMSVVKADEQNRPITWLELYILYRIRGFKKPIDDPQKLLTCQSHS